VLRARDFHLYTQNRREDGGRLVDLWQNGGSAILGHKPPALLREFKNAADRGLLGALPHPLEKRFFRALDRLFPRRIFRIYGPGVSLSGLWEAAGLPPPARACDPAALPPPARACDPAAPFALSGGEPGARPALSVWRPFLDEAAPLAAPDGVPVLIPLLPGMNQTPGRPPAPLILAVDPALNPGAAASEGAAPDCPFPPSDLVPPALLAVLTRGVYDLIAAGPGRGRCPYRKLRAAIDNSPWERRGIYLSLRERPDPETWAGVFRRFLAAGFLVPPEPEEPLILPGALSPGEEAKLAALLTEQSG
jgi:hypothetical protein